MAGSEREEGTAAMDPNALVQQVLRESYLQTTEDLRHFAEKVKYRRNHALGRAAGHVGR
jgi:hypothetical protein